MEGLSGEDKQLYEKQVLSGGKGGVHHDEMRTSASLINNKGVQSVHYVIP